MRAVRFALAMTLLAAGVGGGVFYAFSVLPTTGDEIAALDHPGAGVAALDVNLDPAMNPLRVTLALTRSYAMAGNRLSADVMLLAPDGRALWTETLRLADPREEGPGTSRSTRPVAVFEVPEAGPYRLTASVGGSGTVHAARFTVRRNVQAVRAPWLADGLAEAGLDMQGVFLPRQAEHRESVAP